ncbi:hypothetical protein F4809DRAFT_657814 [Biscogniauxia mediterranea]|nr:hypothetical protein F4809DRAFT_657814 [Biscogniauxia mediterranea]
MFAATSTSSTTPLVDALILGAGPAGLACATALSRQLHTCLVLSSAPASSSSSSSPSPSPSPSSPSPSLSPSLPSSPSAAEKEKGEKDGYRAPHFRNARARHMHNVLGWEHADPGGVPGARAGRPGGAVRGTRRRCGTGWRSLGVLERIDGGKETQGGRTRFRAVDARGEAYEGRKLVLACGIRDVMPDIPGYAELWGRGIFHCLFCHGYESRGRASRDRVHGRRRIAALARDPAVENEGEAGVLVTLADGSVAREGFLLTKIKRRTSCRTSSFPALVAGLQVVVVVVAPQDHVEARPPFWGTGAPGGCTRRGTDCATPLLRSVATAAAMGLAHELQAEDDVEEE